MVRRRGHQHRQQTQSLRASVTTKRGFWPNGGRSRNPKAIKQMKVIDGKTEGPALHPPLLGPVCVPFSSSWIWTPSYPFVFGGLSPPPFFHVVSVLPSHPSGCACPSTPPYTFCLSSEHEQVPENAMTAWNRTQGWLRLPLEAWEGLVPSSRACAVVLLATLYSSSCVSEAYRWIACACCMHPGRGSGGQARSDMTSLEYLGKHSSTCPCADTGKGLILTCCVLCSQRSFFNE